NAFLLFLVAGGHHARLYLRRAQEHSFKYNGRWSVGGSRKFLWKDLAKDHMFWSLISGCSFWMLFETIDLLAPGFRHSTTPEMF
ncbi:MAG: hypothetical protein VX092_07205, partial [SAR324 cluster bacterium]|nr:hypothetical protein [SAR324 cluster bacterium]